MVAGLVAPPDPDQLRARLPELPPAEAIEEDLLDERSPEQKKAAAQDEIAGVRAFADQRRAGVTAEVGDLRASVRAQGQTRKTEVKERLATALADFSQRVAVTRAHLTAAAAARKNQLRGEVEADAVGVRETTNANVTEARQAMAAKRRMLVDAGTAERDRALTAADSQAARAAGELEAAAADCERAGEQQAARYPGEEDPKPEQRAAARRVGRESAADIRAKRAEIRPELRAKAAEHGQRCVEYVNGVARQIADAEQTLVDKVTETGRLAEQAVRDGLAGAQTAVDNRLASDLAAVDATAAATRTQLNSAAAKATGALDSDTATASAELTASEKALDSDIDNAATETTTVLAEPERPFLPGVIEQSATTRGQIAVTAELGQAQLAAATAGVERQLAANAAAFNTAATTSTGVAGSQFEHVIAGFAAAIDRAAAARAEASAAILAQLRQQQQQLTGGVLAEAESAAQNAHAELGRMRGDYDRTIVDAASRAVEEGSRPKTDDVNTRSQAAAESVTEGILAGIGRALVKIAIGLVVLVAVALLVAAVAAIFGTLLTAWSAIMIAGAILLAATLVISLVNRLGQRELAGRPGTAILVALADTVGVTGIYEGIRGRDIVTGTPITSVAERTERGVLGAVTLVSLIFGVRSAVRGLSGGVPLTRPVSGVPGWASLGVFGRALAGAKGVAVEIAGAIASGVRSFKQWWANRGGTGPGPDTGPGQGGRYRPPPTPGELPPTAVDPAVTRLGELAFKDMPGQVPEGQNITVPEGSQVATVEATLPDGRFGWTTCSYDPATGQFRVIQVNTDSIPAELRTVPTGPGQRVPLSDYLSIRAMRLLNVMVGRLRTIRIQEVESVRTVLQVRRGDPVAGTQVVRGVVDTAVRAGGRVLDARIVEGTGSRTTLGDLLKLWEGDTPPADMVAKHNAILAEFGLTRDQHANVELLASFDVIIRLQPAPEPIPPPISPGSGGGRQDAGTD